MKVFEAVTTAVASEGFVGHTRRTGGRVAERQSRERVA